MYTRGLEIRGQYYSMKLREKLNNGIPFFPQNNFKYKYLKSGQS